jgi:ABC-2 type transport system permease protein
MWVFIGLMIVINLFVSIFVRFVLEDVSFRFWDFIQISSYLLILTQLLSMIIAGDIVSSEFEKGTIKLLLIRPVNRIKILSSKYMTVLMVVVFFVTIQLLISLLLGVVFFSGTLFDIDQTVLFGLASYFFKLIEIIVYCTIAFCLSTLSRSSVFSIAISIFLFFTSGALMTVLEHFNYQAGKYLLFANTNLMPYFSGNPIFEGMTLGFSILNIILYMSFFSLLSFLSFSKRNIYI